MTAGANLTNYLNANIGDLKNVGVEFEINAVAIQNRDWYWNIGLNAAWNRNEITRLTTDDEREDYYGVDTGGISGAVGTTVQVHQTGQPTNSFYVYQQIYDENGRPMEGMYVDRNGDGVVDAKDKYCYKKAAPDVTLGFNTQLSWKALTLAVSAHANFGNYVYDNISSNGELLTDLWTNNFVNNRVVSAVDTNFRTDAQYLSGLLRAQRVVPQTGQHHPQLPLRSGQAGRSSDEPQPVRYGSERMYDYRLQGHRPRNILGYRQQPLPASAYLHSRCEVQFPGTVKPH